MRIDTTLYVRKELVEKITFLTTCFNVSKNDIVTKVLKMAPRFCQKNNFQFKPVSYQKPFGTCPGKKLHVCLPVALYEHCLDIRKFCKMSVSSFFSAAFNKFYNKLIKELEKGDETDNYDCCYIFSQRTIDDIFSYQVYWGIPEGKILLKHLGST